MKWHRKLWVRKHTLYAVSRVAARSSDGPAPPCYKSIMSIPGRLFLSFSLLCFAAGAVEEPALRGYSSAAARAERDWEAKFRAIPNPTKSARLHAASLGAPAPRRLALRQGQRRVDPREVQGLGTGREHRDLRRSVPHAQGARAGTVRAHALHRQARRNPRLPWTPLPASTPSNFPTYNAYSIDGDVTAPLVYVNYGIPEDYEQLERMGISVKGAIVIARYGASWRGIKPKVAAEHGAVGCLIYSDPARGRLLAGRGLSQGPYRPKRRRAARQRDGHAGVSRRSADARVSAPPRMPSASRSKRPRRSPRFRCCRSPTAMRSRCWRR